MSTLGDALHRTARALSEAGLPHMVVGGIATVVWGEPRATRDVDVTVDVAGRSIDELIEVARRIGEPMAAEPEEVAERGRLIPVRTPEGIEVDLILATLSFELEAIGRAHTVNIEGEDIHVCGPEDLLLHKIVSERPRDHEDAIGVLKRQSGRLDMARLDAAVAAIAAELGEPGIAERFEATKRAAGW